MELLQFEKKIKEDTAHALIIKQALMPIPLWISSHLLNFLRTWGMKRERWEWTRQGIEYTMRSQNDSILRGRISIEWWRGRLHITTIRIFIELFIIIYGKSDQSDLTVAVDVWMIMEKDEKPEFDGTWAAPSVATATTSTAATGFLQPINSEPRARDENDSKWKERRWTRGCNED